MPVFEIGQYTLIILCPVLVGLQYESRNACDNLWPVATKQRSGSEKLYE